MHDRRPKAGALAEEIAVAIEDGHYPPGVQLPTEAQLVAAHGIARTTARAAYSILVERGLVRSVRGHGWYVREDTRLQFPLLTIENGRASAVSDIWRTFLVNAKRKGDHYSPGPVSEPPPERVRRLLEMDPGERAVARHRIRRVDGVPWMLSTAYFPGWLADGTPLATEHDMQNPSALRWLIENGYRTARCEDLISARMPTSHEGRLLAIPRGTPLMTVCRTGWDKTGRPIRCTVEALPAHRFELTVAHHPQD